MATNKIIYGNDTLIDLTGDTVTASDVASGKTFHGKDGVQTVGTATAPTEITPSNSERVQLIVGNTYKIKNWNGYAIESYTNVNPSEEGEYFTAGFKVMTASGYAYTNRVSPSAMTETVLWTNPDPSSPSTGFAGQDVTLSDDITN